MSNEVLTPDKSGMFRHSSRFSTSCPSSVRYSYVMRAVLLSRLAGRQCGYLRCLSEGPVSEKAHRNSGFQGSNFEGHFRHVPHARFKKKRRIRQWGAAPFWGTKEIFFSASRKKKSNLKPSVFFRTPLYLILIGCIFPLLKKVLSESGVS